MSVTDEFILLAFYSDFKYLLVKVFAMKTNPIKILTLLIILICFIGESSAQLKPQTSKYELHFRSLKNPNHLGSIKFERSLDEKEGLVLLPGIEDCTVHQNIPSYDFFEIHNDQIYLHINHLDFNKFADQVFQAESKFEFPLFELVGDILID